jgi:hypothetical protein
LSQKINLIDLSLSAFKNQKKKKKNMALRPKQSLGGAHVGLIPIVELKTQCQGITKQGERCSLQAKVQIDVASWTNWFKSHMSTLKSKIPSRVRGWVGMGDDANDQKKSKIDCCRFCVRHAAAITLISATSLAFWLQKQLTMSYEEYVATYPDEAISAAHKNVTGKMLVASKKKKKQGRRKKGKKF